MKKKRGINSGIGRKQSKPILIIYAYAGNGEEIGRLGLDPPLQEDSVGCCEMRAVKIQIKKASSEDDIIWMDSNGNQYIYWQWDMFAEFYRADL